LGSCFIALIALANLERNLLVLSQRELVEKAGISQPAFSQMERNDNLFDVTLEKLALGMGLNPEQLVVLVSPVNLAPVADTQHQNDNLFLLDLADYPVISNTIFPESRQIFA